MNSTSPKKISDFHSKIKVLFTDIDDTLTIDGQLTSDAYASIWNLYEKGISVIPITGRPAGWCELIARQWPVKGVIGENGALYFTYKNRQMYRKYFVDEAARLANQKSLDMIREEVLREVPGSAVASDQFCRLFDLAIDFCEDVTPLGQPDIDKIVSIFKRHGAVAKVSSIHVNGWFGSYDKLSMALEFLKTEFNWTPDEAKKNCAFCGDSPNDEPMFGFFPHSFAVANIKNFINKLEYKPTYVADEIGGKGFAQVATRIIANI